jgi:hypothetical protein
MRPSIERGRIATKVAFGLGVLLALVAALAMTSYAQGEDPPPQIIPPSNALSVIVVDSADIPQGGETILHVTLTQDASAPGLVSYQGNFVYDFTVIEVLEIIFPEQCPVWAANIEQGFVRYAATKCSGDPEDFKEAVLFSIRILGIGVPGTMTTIFPTFDIFHDFDLIFIPHEIEAGKVTIIGGNPPVADFEYEPRTPKENQKINFKDLSSDPEGGEIVAWEWDFGDGNGSTEQHPMHRYPNVGTYAVTLVVTNDRGLTGAVTKNVKVGPARPCGLYSYPNPAKTFAIIDYCLPDGSTQATLRIFNLQGKLVKSQALNLSESDYRWDLKDERGNDLPNGPYFFFARAVTPGGVINTRVEVLIIER